MVAAFRTSHHNFASRTATPILILGECEKCEIFGSSFTDGHRLFEGGVVSSLQQRECLEERVDLLRIARKYSLIESRSEFAISKRESASRASEDELTSMPHHFTFDADDLLTCWT